MFKNNAKEIKIGITFIVAVAILFFGLNFLKGINIFSSSNRYFAVYKDIGGLVISNPVNIKGYKVGQVRKIRYDFESEPFAHVERNLYIQPRRHYVENVEALSVVARRRFDKRYSNDARWKKNRHRRFEQSNLYEHFDDALFDFFRQCKKIV